MKSETSERYHLCSIKKAICGWNMITLWFQALVMGKKSNIWSINTMCTYDIASELHPSLPHLFTILCSILCFFIFFFTAGPVWKIRDSCEQIPLQDYFTAAFNQVEPTEKYKFLSIYEPCHKKKKLYASFVFKTLKIQLYDFSIDIVRLASKDREILSWFVTLLKKTEKSSLKKSKRTSIQHICKELKPSRITRKIPN